MKHEINLDIIVLVICRQPVRQTKSAILALQDWIVNSWSFSVTYTPLSPSPLLHLKRNELWWWEKKIGSEIVYAFRPVASFLLGGGGGGSPISLVHHLRAQSARARERSDRAGGGGVGSFCHFYTKMERCAYLREWRIQEGGGHNRRPPRIGSTMFFIHLFNQNA